MSAVSPTWHAVEFDRLYRHHAQSVYRYTFAVLGNHADAEDVTQQTFLSAYRAFARGTNPRKAENWLLRIAHNEVRRHFRSIQRKANDVRLAEDVAEPPSERSDPSLNDVLGALQSLPPIQRSALVMREFEGRSYAEIAQIMGISQSALEAQTFRARRALAERLEEGFTCNEAEEALRIRLDRRLPRRVGRRLKAHLQECRACERFEKAQRRRRILGGLSISPIPASLFFRAKETAAAGLGPATAAAGGSAGVGGVTALGGAGTTVGLAAKVAAVTAAAAVAGGVGYEVSGGRTVEGNIDQKVADARGARAPRLGRVADDIRFESGGRAQRGLRSVTAAAVRNNDEAKPRPMHRVVAGKVGGGPREKTSRRDDASPRTTGAAKPKPRPAGAKGGARNTPVLVKQKPKPTRRAAPSQRRSTSAPGRKASAATPNPRTERYADRPEPVEQPPKIRQGKAEAPKPIERGLGEPAGLKGEAPAAQETHRPGGPRPARDAPLRPVQPRSPPTTPPPPHPDRGPR